MDVYENTTIFIACPANCVTGGPELLHQLASELLRRGLRVFLWYPDAKSGCPPQPGEYRKYRVPYVQNITDAPEHIVMFPETMTVLLPRIHHARCILWWLSVDNYLNSLRDFFADPPSTFASRPLAEQIFLFSPGTRLEHWVQSEYARQFVLQNHVPAAQVYTVGDYLQSATHLGALGTTAGGRLDIVTYNPKKGFEFTQKLIDAAPDIKWAPIINMTAEEVHTLLAHAKCYIDFGNHPGQDRLPREAAMAGCCVITGRRGAAANDIDVPIPASYKFDNHQESIPRILACIRSCLTAYAVHRPAFKAYRAMIAGQKERFRHDVAAALPVRYDVPARRHIVVQNGPHLKDRLLTLLSDATIDIVGVWFDEIGPGEVRLGQHEIPILWPDEVPFLYQEGRIDAILLDETNGKGAAELAAHGVPDSILC